MLHPGEGTEAPSTGAETKRWSLRQIIAEALNFGSRANQAGTPGQESLPSATNGTYKYPLVHGEGTMPLSDQYELNSARARADEKARKGWL